jgi:hypothetical protein
MRTAALKPFPTGGARFVTTLPAASVRTAM